MRGLPLTLAIALFACGSANKDAAHAPTGGASGHSDAGFGNVATSGSGNVATSGSGNVATSGSGNVATSGSGNVATSGSGSGNTPPPHVVGKCDGLGAVGLWEEVSPPGLHKQPPFLGALVGLVDPNNAGTLYVTTSQSGVFKSTDCGASWTKTNTGRNGDKIDQGLVWSAALDPVSPGTLYAITGYGPSGVWKTTNGGVDWDNIMPMDKGMPGFVARVSMDPTDHLHLLINFHDNCSAGHTPVCIGETKDGGKTWNVLDFPTSLKDGWGEGTFVLPIDATHWLFEFWELYYTGDAGQTWKRVDTGGAAAIQGPFFKAPDGTYWLASAQGVLTSATGEKWTRVPDSFGAMDGIVGCGNSLFGIVGFGPPPTNDYVFTATYQEPMKWSVRKTPGLPSPVSSGANSIVCDSDHNIVYASAQGAGLWRMVAEGPTKTTGGANSAAGASSGGGGAGGPPG